MIRRGRNDPRLFSDDILDHVLASRKGGMGSAIERCDPARLLASRVDDLVAEFVATGHVDPLLFNTEGVEIEDSEGRFPIVDFGRHINVAGTKIAVYVPFRGDPTLFQCHPSASSSVGASGRVTESHIILGVETTDDDSAAVRQFIEREVDGLARWVGWVNADIERHNRELEGLARRRIEERAERLRRSKEMIANLGFRLRRREGMPEVYAVPLKRKRLVSRSASSSTSSGTPATPDPTLADADYSEILNVLENMSLVMERNPGPFERIKEEFVRDMFLVSLNGLYEGAATGETFNYTGKTDILIREKGKNIFIAECKFWKGAASFSRTIDQLFDYLSWRDSKTAILVFVRNVAPSTVIEQIPGLLSGHKAFKRSAETGLETRHRAIMRHPTDPERELTLTVMTFDLARPTKTPRRPRGKSTRRKRAL